VKRLIEEIVGAVIGAAIVSAILYTSTPLTPGQLAWATASAGCLVLGGLRLFDLARNRITRRNEKLRDGLKNRNSCRSDRIYS
jgi:hypothetical protein